jgi:putative nucleotidyltransferase with HDIG domain
MILRDESLERVKQYVKNDGLVKHMIAVSAIMRGVAERLGEDTGLWEAVGMLHDIDYEEVGGDWNRHGLVSAEMVAGVLPEEGLHAIKAHNSLTGVEAKSAMDVALFAADGLSGLVVATGLMMPDRKLAQVKVKSLTRKFKDNSFARGVNRENIMRCEELGLGFEEFLALGLSSMQAVSDELGL